MNVLSLFDGMSCGRIALDRLGIPVDKYYASEIDKYATQVSEANYPDIIRLGDVCGVKAEDLEPIDLLIAGSPCQGFSFAGKQLAFDDPRSALFFEFVRLLKECKPKYFLLENVRMKKEFLDIISEQVGCEPIFINSALVSAQNRQRFYWTNIPGIEQPEQRGIVLRDILEDNFDSERDKSHCLDANYYKGGSVENYFKKSRRQMVFQNDTPIQVGTAVDINGHDVLKRVYSPDGKSPTVNTCQGGNREPKVITGGAISVETISNKENKSYALTASYSAARPRRSKAKHEKTMVKVNDTNNLPSGTDYIYDQNDKSHKITDGNIEPKVAVQSYREVRTEEAKRLRRESKQKTGKDHTPFRAKELQPREDGKVGTVTPSLNNDHKISLTKDNEQEVYWRKLTPVECERLQTVPDNYTDCVSNTQRYKMLGNGWTIEVIAHIFKNMQLLEEGKEPPTAKGQLTLDF